MESPHIISGGSRDNEVNELIVTPIGSNCSSEVVIIATPVAKQPIAFLRSFVFSMLLNFSIFY